MENCLHTFLPQVKRWFEHTYGVPTPVQKALWPIVRDGKNVVASSPTGSGKTLAAFLVVIDEIWKNTIFSTPSESVYLLYISPLKALGNDIETNLRKPLSEILHFTKSGEPSLTPLTISVRTGDCSSYERTKQRLHPPHILVTTPESLYLLLTSSSGRKILQTVRTVIVDELHWIADNNRGAHLSLSLERLEHVCKRQIQRIGLSATMRPMETLGHFLSPSAPCHIIDLGIPPSLDARLELPFLPLGHVMPQEGWDKIYRRIIQLTNHYHTMLVFVNTRRLAEKMAHHLGLLMDPEKIGTHHGSLSKETRKATEKKFKEGKLNILVATASLELGIDIGSVEGVCQMGSPRSVSSFIQRIGRSNHNPQNERLPHGHLFPLDIHDLVECVALLYALKQGKIESIHLPEAPLDVLMQQIVAEVAAEPWEEKQLYALFSKAYPYRNLSFEKFHELTQLLCDGFHPLRGSQRAFLFFDSNGWLRAKKGAKLKALTSGGTIPDSGDYIVALESDETRIGTVNEDFALESLIGDIFLLGNHPWKIKKVKRGKVLVEDAAGSNPTIPFWLGEAPARSPLINQAIDTIRKKAAEFLQSFQNQTTATTLSKHFEELIGISKEAAEELARFFLLTNLTLGTIPSADNIVLERFFDPTEGTQLVIHSPLGLRLNRAWGLALRKRFCRKFNFELQAAASEEGLVLSLTTIHSFPLKDLMHFLSSHSIRELLSQALIDAPFFGIRWRWTATTALAIPKIRAGKFSPPLVQKMEAENLLSLIFPEATACLENIIGNRSIPKHPLVEQTLAYCLEGVLDCRGLEQLLASIEKGAVLLTHRESINPSFPAVTLLSSAPYTYLDPAPLEERRSRSVPFKTTYDPEELTISTQLPQQAIEQFIDSYWQKPKDQEVFFDFLSSVGFLTNEDRIWSQCEDNGLTEWAEALRKEGKIFCIHLSTRHNLWFAQQWLSCFSALYPTHFSKTGESSSISLADALPKLLQARLQYEGPVSSKRLALILNRSVEEVDSALQLLEAQGVVFRGRFQKGSKESAWCHRSVLSQLHKLSRAYYRSAIQPVAIELYQSFLYQWQRLTADTKACGLEGLFVVLKILEGYFAPLESWEKEILPSRMENYDPSWLDQLSLSGRIVWVIKKKSNRKSASFSHSSCSIAFLERAQACVFKKQPYLHIHSLALSSRAKRLYELIVEKRALFFDELLGASKAAPWEIESDLKELVGYGLVRADCVSALRHFFSKKKRLSLSLRLALSSSWGRWTAETYNLSIEKSILRLSETTEPALPTEKKTEKLLRMLLRRYGIFFKKLLEKEKVYYGLWPQLLPILRLMEMREELLAGQFIEGIGGEQFALPEAITMLKKIKEEPSSPFHPSVSVFDPSSLSEIIKKRVKQ